MSSSRSRWRRRVEDARRVVEAAQRTGKKLVIGYILRHHPSWIEFIRLARELGPPFVMRMNLNQQSSGAAWAIHKRLMESTSPVVDCGVHYLDVMCQITDARPVQVRGMGVRLSDEIAARPGQFRPSPGAVRGRLDRLVRGRLGPDDLRDRLLREGRDEPQGLGLDRHGRGRQVGRHRHPHQDGDDPPASRRRSMRTAGSSARTNSSRCRTSPAIRRSASASRPSS